MRDRRLTACNGRVAAAALQGRVAADRFVEGQAARVAVPVVGLRRAPDGPRERELCLGAAVRVYDVEEGWCFVQADADSYVGYLPDEVLSRSAAVPTHRVISRGTHGYVRPDIKSDDRMFLPIGAQIAVSTIEGRFARADAGFVPADHVAPLGWHEADPVAVAERLIGTPYLWGGNSPLGIDCSGLVQLACHLAGIPCPGDSDLQEAALGHDLPEGTPLRRGDLLFWKGHVAWVAGPDLLLHANAHHMAVAFEPLGKAVARIVDQGDGPVTRRARL